MWPTSPHPSGAIDLAAVSKLTSTTLGPSSPIFGITLADMPRAAAIGCK